MQAKAISAAKPPSGMPVVEFAPDHALAENEPAMRELGPFCACAVRSYGGSDLQAAQASDEAGHSEITCRLGKLAQVTRIVNVNVKLRRQNLAHATAQD